MKRRNPRMGYRKIAEQISSSFGLEINKDVVRRILNQYYRPAPGGTGPSWLSVIGPGPGQSLERRPLPL
jgi:hypothetical protein